MDWDYDKDSCMINKDSVCLEILNSDSENFFKKWKTGLGGI